MGKRRDRRPEVCGFLGGKRLTASKSTLLGETNEDIIAKEIIRNAPTVDAVPVVRCRECENWKPYGSKASRKLGDPLERYGGCEIWHGGHLESDFCSYGEREEEQNGRT